MPRQGAAPDRDLGRGRADQPLVSATNTAGLKQINTLEGFDAIWELDLFGKFRREIEATKYDAQAAAAARYDVVTTVIADVVRAYIDLRGFQVQPASCGRPSMFCATPFASRLSATSAASSTSWMWRSPRAS